MGVAIFPSRWNSTPSGPLTINWGHPLAQYLVACVVASPSGLRELVTGTQLGSLAGVTLPSFASGNGISGVKIGATTGSGMTALPNMKFVDGLTVFSRFLFTGTPDGDSEIFGIFYSSALTVPYYGCVIRLNTSGGLAGASNVSGSRSTVPGTGSAGISLNKPITASFHAGALGRSLLVDGYRLFDDTTTQNPISFTSASQLAVGDLWAEGFNAKMILDIGYVWGGPQMKGCDLTWLHNEPFAILSPLVRRRYFIASQLFTGSGNTTIGAPTISGSGGLTLTGAGGTTIGHPTISGAAAEVITGNAGTSISGPTMGGLGATIIPQPQWTTNRLFVSPTGSAGVTLVPDATPWTNSVWSIITNSAPGSWILCGLIIHPDVTGATTDFEIDIGIGPIGAEVVIDTYRGHYGATFYVSPGVLPRSVPLDNITSGSRVVARLRKSTTSVNPWTVKAYYYKLPITGVLQTTTKPQKVYPPAAANVTLTIGASAWVNSTWTAIATPGTDICIVSAIPDTAGFSGTEYEFDIGIGAGPTVVDTIRLNNTMLAATDGPDIIPLYSPRFIPSGSLISVRTRCSIVASRGASIALQYMELPL